MYSFNVRILFLKKNETRTEELHITYIKINKQQVQLRKKLAL